MMDPLQFLLARVKERFLSVVGYSLWLFIIKIDIKAWEYLLHGRGLFKFGYVFYYDAWLLSILKEALYDRVSIKSLL